jgi:hypothetical protein
MRNSLVNPSRIGLFAPIEAIGLVQRLLIREIALSRANARRSLNDFRYQGDLYQLGAKSVKGAEEE